MARTIQQLMSTDLATCPETATIADAARIMRDRNIGDVLVTRDGGQLVGIVTDRDLVVRCLADGATAHEPIGHACSTDIASVSTECSIDDAVRLMTERSLRRLPVVDNGRAVGIVTLGDLAIERDPHSALGSISAAASNT